MTIPTIRRRLLTLCGVLLLAQVATAEVVRIDIRRKDDFGTYERMIGRVYFAVDPKLPANRGIADIDQAPKNAAGLVEFSSDVLFFRPKDAGRARGTVFLEVVNRGRDQSLAIMSGARQRDLSPESWDLGDQFLLEQGFAVAFLGWQFDVAPSEGLTFDAPIAPVEGLVRESHIETDPGLRGVAFRLSYCAPESGQKDATVTFRARMDDTPRALPRDTWQFARDGCVAQVGTVGVGLYEAVYRAKGSPVAGLGLAAMRDFASYLKHGDAGAALRETPGALQRVIGYGYSQSGRYLREFVRDGFNADERGRAAFDALMISSAGAGGGSFNHRFAMPGVAGNSVLSALRPVDLPPFTDEGLLARARAANVTPKIFYTFSSTEYWARAGSLTHTSDDGLKDVPLAATSRLYFLAGTPHSSGVLPLGRPGWLKHFSNFAEQRWVSRALLLDLDAWTRNEQEPPASEYPSVSKRELVALPGRPLSRGAVVPVHDLHAAGVADGLRARLCRHESDHNGAAEAGCAVPRAGPAGERGRQRRVRRSPARAGRSSGYLHGLERDDPAVGRSPVSCGPGRRIRTVSPHEGAAGAKRRRASLRRGAIREPF